MAAEAQPLLPLCVQWALHSCPRPAAHEAPDPGHRATWEVGGREPLVASSLLRARAAWPRARGTAGGRRRAAPGEQAQACGPETAPPHRGCPVGHMGTSTLLGVIFPHANIESLRGSVVTQSAGHTHLGTASGTRTVCGHQALWGRREARQTGPKLTPGSQKPWRATCKVASRFWTSRRHERRSQRSL